MATYRVKICKPDNRGYYRPQIGDIRFTVGHKNDISEGEAQRRRDALQMLYDRQQQLHGMGKWASWVLPYAKQIEKTGKVVFEVSESAKSNAGLASEEALLLQRLRSVGLTISPTDPEVIAQGERQLRQWIDERVRAAVEKTVSENSSRMEIQGELATRVLGTMPDPTKSETRTFFEALRAFRKNIETTGKRTEDGTLAPSPKKYIAWCRRFEDWETDFPLWELDKQNLSVMTARWTNRPISKKTGKKISTTYSKHMVDALWAMLTWIDESADWKWEMPKGARQINRTPVRITSDLNQRRTRRISGSTYNPEQLALIARQLPPLGKLILGVSVNCAMQAAECGRLQIGDFYETHPDTKKPGDWIIFERPKTGEYGEWLLWKEVAQLVRWGIRRSKQIGSEILIVQQNGEPWYKDGWTNPATKFGCWWQAIPSKSDPHIGVVTKLQRAHEGFPRHTLKTLRKILPNLFRPEFGREIADLVNARKIDDSGRISGADTDRYADRLYDKVAEAITKFESHFRPFLDALGECDLGMTATDSDDD